MKTADEMFREAGYERVRCGERWIVYSDTISNTTITLDKELGIFSCAMGESEYGFTYKEILACAQLIKETEADNG